MALTQAKLETALNVTFTGTPDLPTYTKDDVVYISSEYDGSASAGSALFTQNPYKVTQGSLKFDLTDVFDINDAAADGSGTAAQKMWWYEIQNVGTSKKSVVHQSTLIQLAALKTLIGTESSSWTDPA